jgi:hypothetical protein
MLHHYLIHILRVFRKQKLPFNSMSTDYRWNYRVNRTCQSLRAAINNPVEALRYE